MRAMKSAAAQLAARISIPLLVSQKFVALATGLSLEISKAEHIGH